MPIKKVVVTLLMILIGLLSLKWALRLLVVLFVLLLVVAIFTIIYRKQQS